MTTSATKALTASIEAMQREMEGLRKRLKDEIERNFLLETLLEESGYRRVHQIDTAEGPLPDDIKVEKGDMALALSVAARHPDGLEVSVLAFDEGKIVISGMGRNGSVLKEAMRRAKAKLADARGMLLPELGRNDVTAILNEELGWARAASNYRY